MTPVHDLWKRTLGGHVRVRRLVNDELSPMLFGMAMPKNPCQLCMRIGTMEESGPSDPARTNLIFPLQVHRSVIGFSRFFGAVKGHDDAHHKRAREPPCMPTTASAPPWDKQHCDLALFPRNQAIDQSSPACVLLLPADSEWATRSREQAIIDEQKTYLPVSGQGEGIHTIYDIQNIIYRCVPPDMCHPTCATHRVVLTLRAGQGRARRPGEPVVEGGGK